MIEFSSIAFFRSRLMALKDVNRGVYATVEDEVIATFKGFTIEQMCIPRTAPCSNWT